MRKSLKIILLIVASFLCAQKLSAKENSKKCSRQDAIDAEQIASSFHIKDWQILLFVYERFKSCDDASIGEGFSDAVSEIFLNTPGGGVEKLQRMIDRSPRFKGFVLKHIDELTTREDAAKIRNRVEVNCTPNAKSLCQDIVKTIDALKY